MRLYIAVAFVKMAIKAIDKNTNEGLSFILTIKNWVDFVNGGNYNDTIYGGDGENNLYGNGGDDYIYGGKDKDIIEGGEGNDTINIGRLVELEQANMYKANITNQNSNLFFL